MNELRGKSYVKLINFRFLKSIFSTKTKSFEELLCQPFMYSYLAPKALYV